MGFCFSVAAYFGGALEDRGRLSAPEPLADKKRYRAYLRYKANVSTFAVKF